MSLTVVDVLIVGAGLTGLNLARQLLAANQNLEIEIVEKSKSCGGRMATRRMGQSRFDHGAQFIKPTAISQALIDFWQRDNVLKKFPTEAFQAYCGAFGMTQLAKKLTENVRVSYNRKVTGLSKSSAGWQVDIEQGASCAAKHVVLTAPLPQSLELLNKSDIPFDAALSAIKFSKAIVLLVQSEAALSLDWNYMENVDQNIFSMCSQQAKGLSVLHEYTIVMQHHWSDEYFEKSDDEILQASKKLLQSKFAAQTLLSLDLKKWRFCQPVQIWTKPFENPQPGLFLAGDAFGGASLNGAIKSSDSLANHMTHSCLIQSAN